LIQFEGELLIDTTYAPALSSTVGSLADELTLSYTRPAADRWPLCG